MSSSPGPWCVRAGSLGGVVLLSPLLCACSLSLSKKQRRVARGAGQAAPAPARTDGNCAVEKLRGKEVRAPPTQCPRAALCCGEASLSTEEGSKLEWSSKYGQVSRGSGKPQNLLYYYFIINSVAKEFQVTVT